jgi:hypothetical protein
MDGNFDFQEAIDKVREMFSGEDGKAQLMEIINAFRDEPQEKTEDKNDGGGFDFDPSMLLKLQKIMSLSGNNENDKSKLLLSLKPFLKDERKNKVDKAVQLMNISKIISVFKDDF